MLHLSFRRTAVARRFSTQPWFVEKEQASPAALHRPSPPPLPPATPAVLKDLHSRLAQSPHLEPSSLIISESAAPPPGPELPRRMPQGRRKKGGTYAGESDYDVPAGIWSWTVMAQVKEGTENKGAIESVIRVVRKTLASTEVPLRMVSKTRKWTDSGWAMVDGGDFVVHILSKNAREKYFTWSRE